MQGAEKARRVTRMYTFLQLSGDFFLYKQYHKFRQIAIGNSPKFLRISQYFLQEVFLARKYTLL